MLLSEYSTLHTVIGPKTLLAGWLFFIEFCYNDIISICITLCAEYVVWREKRQILVRVRYCATFMPCVCYFQGLLIFWFLRCRQGVSGFHFSTLLQTTWLYTSRQHLGILVLIHLMTIYSQWITLLKNQYLWKKNTGCVPKKLMVFASRYPGEIKEMEGYGWKGATEGTFDWKVFLENKNQVSLFYAVFMYLRKIWPKRAKMWLCVIGNHSPEQCLPKLCTKKCWSRSHRGHRLACWP